MATGIQRGENDAEIVARVCNGEREQFAQLVQAYQDRVFAIAFASLRHRQLAEEAVQDAFLCAYTHLRGLRHREKFGPWLCAIVRRTALMCAKRRRSEPASTSTDCVANDAADTATVEPSEQVHRREVADLLRESLDALPTTLAETLTLFYIGENSVSETARLLDISEAAVKTRLHRGRELLRLPLEKILNDELRHLRPSPAILPAIMTTLPSLSMKTGLPALVGSFLFSFVTIQTIVVLGSLWFFNHLYRKSFNDPNDYRAQRMSPRTWLKIAIAVLLFLYVSMQSFAYFGPQIYNGAFGAFAIIGGGVFFLQDIRLWKVGSRGAFIQHAGLVLCGVVWMLSPFIPSMAYELFFLGMLLIMASSWLRIVGGDVRGDGSLFLRAAMNEVPRIDGELPALPISQAIQKNFAKTLGRDGLCFGADVLPDGSCWLALPIVQQVPSSAWLPTPWASLSKVHIGADAQVKAYISPRDVSLIQKKMKCAVTGDEIASLELRVARAVQSSLVNFVHGDSEQMKRSLCTRTEAEIFKNGAYRRTPLVRFYNKYFAFVIIPLVIVAVVIYIHERITKPAQPHHNVYYNGPISSAPAEVRQRMAERSSIATVPSTSPTTSSAPASLGR